MRRRAFLCFFLLSICPAFAGTELPIALDDGADAQISVNSPYNNLPPYGYAPIAININNFAEDQQTWSFEFASPGLSFLSTNSIVHTTSLTVPPKSARSFRILVPLTMRSNNSYFVPLAVRVTGPGTNAGSMAQFPTGNRSGKPATAFIAISESLATHAWSELEKEVESQKEQLAGTRFRAEDLPADWRALIGISALWLTASEIDQLSAAQRASLYDWISRGGILYICGQSHTAAQFQPAGFGNVVALPATKLDAGPTALLIHSLPRTLEQGLTNDYHGAWQARREVGEIEANVPLLTIFLLLFGLFAGPGNLFLFAGHGRRHRLFWTTPVISLAASALLFVLIVLQDGFGGTGARVALVQLLPASQKSVTLQEQVARTGIIPSASFTTREPAFIAPISLDMRPNAPKRRYGNADTKFAGDWFTSRSLQGHWVESIAPTRGTISLVKLAGTGNSDGPVIVSSLAVPLDDVYFRDDHGGLWHGRNVRTGDKVTLEKIPFIPELLPTDAGLRLQAAWKEVKDQSGIFYATTTDSRSMIDTLHSIRWSNQHAIYIGPMLAAAP